jgi:hypothetical protein
VAGSLLLIGLLLLGSPAWSAEPTEIAVAHLDRPIWLLGLDDARWLFEFRSRAIGAKVSVFPLANASASDLKEPAPQREDEVGRATRSLALFLAERIFAETTCRSSAEVPVARGAGPVVSGKEWSIETLTQAAKEASPAVIISGALERRDAGTRVAISVWDAATRRLEVTIEDVRYLEKPTSSALFLADRVVEHLVTSSRCERIRAPSGWERPTEDLVIPYVDTLGELLQQALAENGLVPASSIRGEADLLGRYSTLRQRMPSSVPARLIYVRGILMSKAYGGSAHEQLEADLASEAGTAANPPSEVNRLAPLIFAGLGQPARCRDSKLALGRGADEAYSAWLGRVKCD